jgi:hypothetical protein
VLVEGVPWEVSEIAMASRANYHSLVWEPSSAEDELLSLAFPQESVYHQERTVVRAGSSPRRSGSRLLKSSRLVRPACAELSWLYQCSPLVVGLPHIVRRGVQVALLQH